MEARSSRESLPDMDSQLTRAQSERDQAKLNLDNAAEAMREAKRLHSRAFLVWMEREEAFQSLRISLKLASAIGA
jgi:hypothetical protein